MNVFHFFYISVPLLAPPTRQKWGEARAHPDYMVPAPIHEVQVQDIARVQESSWQDVNTL